MAASWPSRPNLPSVLLAIEFSSPEEAKKFFPVLRDFIPKLLPTPTPESPAESTAPTANPPASVAVRTDKTLTASEPETVQVITPRQVAGSGDNPATPGPSSLSSATGWIAGCDYSHAG